MLKAVPGGRLPDGRQVKPFRMSACKITVGQFREFVRATGYKTDAEKDHRGWGYFAEGRGLESGRDYTWEKVGWEQRDNHPVVNVTWRDALEFCRWRSQKDGQTYDLPTNAEWETAYRGGPKVEGGEALVRVANVADAAMRSQFPDLRWPLRGASDKFAFTAPVGPFRANTVGLYDLEGNVAEWCRDWFDEQKARAAKNPDDPESGVERVCRGGTWYHDLKDHAPDHREGSVMTHRHCTLGFRVVVRGAPTAP